MSKQSEMNKIKINALRSEIEELETQIADLSVALLAKSEAITAADSKLVRAALEREATIVEKQLQKKKDEQDKKKKLLKQKEEVASLPDEIDYSAKDEVFELIELKHNITINYITTEDRYLIRCKPHNGKEYYTYVQHAALPRVYSDFAKGNTIDYLTHWLEAMNRKFKNITYSWNDVPEHTLNLMSREGWIQPCDDPDVQVPQVIDVLLQSVSSGKQENRNFIEQCIARKYLHPEDYNIPCIVLFGEGGSGKNQLVEWLLARVFGDEQIVVTKTDAIAKFNSSIEGKTVVAFDESFQTNDSTEGLKTLINNKNVQVEEKMRNIRTSANTAMYFILSNSLSNAIRLAGDNSDRRWGVCRIDKPADGSGTLFSWCEKLTGCEDGEEWYCENRDAVTDEQIGAWLSSIIKKWEGKPVRALHGTDFHNLLKSQQRVDFMFVQGVFNQGIEHVTLDTLFKGYCQYIEYAKFDRKFSRNKVSFSQVLDDEILGKLGLIKETHKTKDRTQQVIRKADLKFSGFSKTDLGDDSSVANAEGIWHTKWFENI